MCLQCECEAEVFATKEEPDILPGWRLQRSTKAYCDEWQAGQWGMVQINDPTFYWSGELLMEPAPDASKEELGRYTCALHALEEAIMGVDYLDRVVELFHAAELAGFRPEFFDQEKYEQAVKEQIPVHKMHRLGGLQNKLSVWLLNRMATWITTHPAKSMDEWEAIERGITLEEWLKFKNQVEEQYNAP